ncbi:maltooligosyltrehalose trehalohydrolase [Bradyrhizobium sp. i1.4.4]|uniref:malto-oligosyltrehalose trehalohydrolase n=1 Tax=unclassified Bradyrhizobium TaxID=2631580 RepID=UPI0033939DED
MVEAVIYELHVGTFSDEGTYTGVEKRLDYLRDLGITAIELMPINDVPGRYNWGYDGVLLNAPNARYGRPEDLKRLLRAAHQRDMMVYLDVVYNHFGPQLNYLHSYAQNFFSDRHTTGWGPAVNLEGEHCAFVRQFLIDNALMWLRDYGFDGLRFDAVHALKDGSERHFLVELAESVREQVNGRQVHLMLENEANEAHLLERQDGRATLYDAQWGDDFHNALHVLLTGENEGYYRAFADQPLQHLARSLTEGFAYQGEVFPLHDRPRGEPSAHLPPEATIFFAQNHDQVGNRALGERLAKLVSREKLEQAMALLLLSPHIPMLFMGEEAAAETPFLFFADWTGEAAVLAREGRRKEFAHFAAFAAPEMRDRIPDPCGPKTLLASKLDWPALDRSEMSRRFRALTRDLLDIRRANIVPLLKEGVVRARAELLNARDGSACGLNVQWYRLGGTSCKSSRTSPSKLCCGPRWLKVRPCGVPNRLRVTSICTPKTSWCASAVDFQPTDVIVAGSAWFRACPLGASAANDRALGSKEPSEPLASADRRGVMLPRCSCRAGHARSGAAGPLSRRHTISRRPE